MRLATANGDKSAHNAESGNPLTNPTEPNDKRQSIMTALASTRFSQTLAEISVGYPEHNRRAAELQAEARERYEARHFYIALGTGPFNQATGGKWEMVPRQEARQVLLSMGLERVMRNDEAKYVLTLREFDHAGKCIGDYQCRVGTFPGIKLTDWDKELKKLPTRR